MNPTNHPMPPMPADLVERLEKLRQTVMANRRNRVEKRKAESGKRKQIGKSRKSKEVYYNPASRD